jgi:superkiller protein 3
MKRTLWVTGGLLLALFATAGCSNRAEPPPVKPGTSLIAQALPVPLPADSASATPVTTNSFADGEAAYHARKYGEAVTIFEAYVERRPRNAWGHYMLALSAWKAGDLPKSEQAFEQALGIDPRHVKSYVNLSRVLIDQQRYDEAIARLTRAADVDPESVEVQRLLGRTYHAQARTDEAVSAYRRAIELNERDAWSLNYLGLVYLETERPDEALPLLIQAVEMRKDVAEFHNNLGLALEQTGHLGAAVTAYDSALRADPQFDLAKQNLARIGGR